MASFEDIVTTLPTLTEPQLKELQIRIKVLTKLGGSTSEVEVSDWHLQVLVDTLIGRGISSSGFNIKQLRVGFRNQLEGLKPYLQSVSPARADQMVFWSICLELLLDNLRGMNIPISPRVVVSHLSRIPAIMDVHFPGYARAGLLSMIIKGGGFDHVRQKRGYPTVPKG